LTLQKKSKLPTKQIPPKHLKSVGKSVVCKFSDEFFKDVSNYQTDKFVGKFVNKLENISYIIEINKY